MVNHGTERDSSYPVTFGRKDCLKEEFGTLYSDELAKKKIVLMSYCLIAEHVLLYVKPACIDHLQPVTGVTY